MKADGNVLYPNFGAPPASVPLLDMSVRCQLLFADEYLAVTRLTYLVNGQELIQHVVTGVGVNA